MLSHGLMPAAPFWIFFVEISHKSHINIALFSAEEERKGYDLNMHLTCRPLWNVLLVKRTCSEWEEEEGFSSGFTGRQRARVGLLPSLVHNRKIKHQMLRTTMFQSVRKIKQRLYWTGRSSAPPNVIQQPQANIKRPAERRTNSSWAPAGEMKSYRARNHQVRSTEDPDSGLMEIMRTEV